MLAPTGTIAFMMDCDTTGIEPEFSLVKTKKLVGGGTLKIINNTIPRALRRLGYTEEQIQEITKFVESEETIEGAPHLKDEHLPVFDCADRTARGTRAIHYLGHIKMCGAVQPFLSGRHLEDDQPAQRGDGRGHHGGLHPGLEHGMKSVSIYRDGCKMVQPLTNKERAAQAAGRSRSTAICPRTTRPTSTSSGSAASKGFLTMGLYPEDEELGEIFINFAKQGSTLQGMAMAWAIAISMGLQRGVPLEDYVRMFSHMSFEPAGYTDNQQIPFATSIPDYVVRYLATRFLDPDAQDGSRHPQCPSRTVRSRTACR